MKNLLVSLLIVISATAPLAARAQENAGGAAPMLRAAIFVQNRAGEGLQGQVDVLNDFLSARLTGKGFSVIDKDVVVRKFRESRIEDDQVRRNLKVLEDVIRMGKSEASIEDAISGASALRIAQMIGADYLIMASITSLGTEVRSFQGQGTLYGTDNHSTVYNLRLALKVLEGNQGGTVYGDVVTASERIVAGPGLTIATDDIMPRLLDNGAQKIADNIAGRVDQIRNVVVKTTPMVEFTIASNVEGAVVELDGAVIGSTPGRFAAAPGLHQLRIAKEWLSTWERTVNIYPNQSLNISLELSEEGMRRYGSVELLKTELARAEQDVQLEGKEREALVDIAREKSEADAYATKRIAEGEKTQREQSYRRIEGAPPAINTNLYK